MTRDLVHLRGDPIGVRLFPLLNPQQQVVDLRVARRFATLECGVECRELRICEGVELRRDQGGEASPIWLGEGVAVRYAVPVDLRDLCILNDREIERDLGLSVCSGR
jgi:hypothetical protein